MTKHYEPELGQWAFGQPWQQYEVPEIWEAALLMLSNEIERVTGNIEGRGRDPMSNTGDQLDMKMFSAHAYDWSDEEQPWNFKWRDIRISWYKYLGRGMSANKELSPDLAAEMLTECMNALREWERAKLPLDDLES